MAVLESIEIIDAGLQEKFDALEENLKRLEESSKRVAGGLEDLGESGDDAEAGLDSLAKGVNTAVTALLFFAGAAGLGAALKSAGELAARIQVLNTVLGVVAKNTGLTSQEMLIQIERIKLLGITTKEATEAVIKFAQAQLRASDAAKLARVAQDLAVVAGMNSSQAFGTLTQAIESQQPILLRQFGIVSGLNAIYGEYSKKMRIAEKDMTSLDKKQAVLNKIFEEGEKVAGAYEASMSDAGKQISSFARFQEEASLRFGKALTPAMLIAIETATKLYKGFLSLSDGAMRFVTALSVVITTVLALIGVLKVLKFIGLEATLLAWANPIWALIGILGLLAGAIVYFTSKAELQIDTLLQSAAATESQVLKLESLSKEYETLRNKTGKTTAELDRYRVVSESLNKLVPESVQGINEETRVYDLQLDKITELIAKKKELRDGFIKDAQAELDALKIERDDLQKRADAAAKRAVELERRAKLAPVDQNAGRSYFQGTNLDPNRGELEALAKKQRDEYTKLDAQLVKTTNLYNKYAKAVAESKMTDVERVQTAIKVNAEAAGGIDELTKRAKAAGIAVGNVFTSDYKGKSEEAIQAVLSFVNKIEKAEEKSRALAEENKRVREAVNDQLTGDQGKLRIQLEEVNRALGKAKFGTDEYKRILEAAQPFLQKFTTANEKVKKGLDNLPIAVKAIEDAKFAVELDKWAEKAEDTAKSLMVLSTEIGTEFAAELKKFQEDSVKDWIDLKTKANDDIYRLDKQLSEDIITLEMSDLERKLYANDRHYQSLVDSNNREIALIHKRLLEEEKAINRLADDQIREIESVRQKALTKFEIETKGLTAIEEFRKNLFEAGDNEAERKRIIENFQLTVNAISDASKQGINKQRSDALGLLQTQKDIANQVVASYQDQNRKIQLTNQIMTAFIIKNANQVKAVIQNILSQIASTFFDTLLRMGKGSTAFKQLFLDIFNSIKNSVLSIFNQIVEAWIKSLFKMKAASKTADALGGLLNIGKVGGLAAAPGAAKTAGAGGAGVLGTGISAATATVAAAATGIILSGVGFARLGEKFLGRGKGAAAFGALGGAAAGAAIGSVVPVIGTAIGAAIGFLAGGLTGLIRGAKNNTKKDRGSFLEEAGFKSLDEFRAFLAKSGKGSQGDELFNRAANKIGKNDQAANLQWMKDAAKVLNQIETSKAYDELVKQSGGVDKLKKTMSLLGLSYDEMYQKMKNGDVEGFTADMEKLNKALEEQAKRLQGLSIAAAGFAAMTQGFLQRIDRNFDNILKKMSQENLGEFEDRFKRAQEGGFQGSAGQFLQTAAGREGLSKEDLEAVAGAIKKAQAEFNRLGSAAAATFAGILKETGDIVQALNSIGPSLTALRDEQIRLGLTATGTFENLLRLQEVVTANEDVANSLSGITSILQGLSDAGMLTQAVFSDMGASASAMYQELIDRGVSANDAQLLMQPTLQSLWEAQKKYGYEIDATTQGLIDQGVANGTVGAQFQSVNQQILDVLTAVAKVLGADLPAAYDKTKKATADQAKEAAIANKETQTGTGTTEVSVENLEDSVWSLQDSWTSMGKEAVRVLREIEAAAGGAAEGHSPTGVKQIAYRLQQSRREFRSFRDEVLSGAPQVERSFGQMGAEPTGYDSAGGSQSASSTTAPSVIHVTVQGPSYGPQSVDIDGRTVAEIVTPHIPWVVTQTVQM